MLIKRGGGGLIAKKHDYRKNENYWKRLSDFANEPEVNSVDILFIGDSITELGIWSEYFPVKSVVNRGIGCDVSEGVLNRLNEVINLNPKYVFLLIGVNDVGYEIPESDTVENVKQCLQLLSTKLPNSNIYLESILPSAKFANQSRQINNYYELLVNDFPNVYYIDLYDAFCNPDGIINSSLYEDDLVHLNERGYKVLVYEIQKVLKSDEL